MRARNPLTTCPELKQSMLFPMLYGMEIVAERVAELDKKYGVTPRQVWLLMIAEHRSVSQVVIAECLGIDKNTMVGLVDMTEKAGLVQRIANPENRRENLIKITSKGSGIIREILRTQREFIDEGYAPLSSRDVQKFKHWMIEIIDAAHSQKK